MFYYQFNIGDYASHTSRLSLMEDLAYRRMLDLYYLNEEPLSGRSTDVAREIGMLDQLDSVEYVLNKFFVFHGEKWHQNRVDFEIEQYRKKREQQSKAGKASAKARKTKAKEQMFNERPTPVEQPSNQPNNPRNKKPTNTINSDVDYSCLRMSDEDVLECIRIRKKNSKTAKQGNLTQRIVDKLAKEFELARYIGWSNAEILDEWECRGWLSFESGWIKPKQPTQQIPESERPNLDKAFDLIFNEWHNKNGMMEARQAFKCKFANFTRQQLIGEMEHMDAYKEYALEKIKSGDKTFIGFDNMKFSTFIEKSRWLDLTKEELGIE